jgi:hypothetical protein
MSAQPDTPGPDIGSYEVIHLGGQTAVVVPVADFLRLRALEKAATPKDLEDAEDTSAVLELVEGPGRRQPDDVRARRRSKAPAGHPPVSLRVDYDEEAASSNQATPPQVTGHARLSGMAIM